jgi:predicted metalloprotease with PDZ domain
VVTYTFDDIVEALNAVYPHDWAGFLQDRFQTPGQPAPLAGVEKAGYHLVWKEEPNPYEKGRTSSSGALNLQYSLGVTLSKDGTVTATLWDSAAFNAGIVNSAQIVAVNGEAYSAAGIRKAITDAKGGQDPIELLVRRGERYMTVPVDYHGGLRWPWLEPAGKGEQPLDRLLAPRTK